MLLIINLYIVKTSII